MSYNIINALINLLQNPIIDLQASYVNRNRANSMGDALEHYVQDLFINGFSRTEDERLSLHNTFLIWAMPVTHPT